MRGNVCSQLIPARRPGRPFSGVPKAEQIRRNSKKRYWAHREKILAVRKAKRDADVARVRQYFRDYYAKNREKYAQKYAKRKQLQSALRKMSRLSWTSSNHG